MLRTRKVELPRGLKAFVSRKLKGWADSGAGSWHQDFVPNELRSKLIELCDYPGKKKEATVLLHLISGGVDEHRDCMAKTAYLVPVKLGKNWVFDYELRQTKLEVGKCYRFNDHLHHGVTNKNSTGVAAIFSISFEDR